MNSKKLEELIKNIQTMIKCPHCGSRYTKDNIRIVGHMGQAVLVQLDCTVCKLPVMATIVTSFTGALSDSIDWREKPEMIEASSQDVTETEINSDEILQLHDYLKNFDGNFEQLFGQK